MDELSPSRRRLLAGGATVVTALAGCSALPSRDESGSESDSKSPLDRIVVRSDTGNSEPLRLTLVYGPPEANTERPVWKTVEAPADGEPKTIGRNLETGDGVYSLTAASKRHTNHEVVSFNSTAQRGTDAYQFEVVVKQRGDVWVNLDEAGEPISIPGYDS
ncbi:hypothetical protein [Halorussus ruber]|uniref:hypothetical protein n=1 Tax=Halorussus ruber TaxID=1126238 RepID=UPI00109243E0|nr:hypothetical protein [Halorussus ruber]